MSGRRLRLEPAGFRLLMMETTIRPGSTEGMMVKGSRVRLITALFFIASTLLMNGCGGGQALQREVTTEYLLTTAGFQRWGVNMETPKREALLNNLPKGKITTFTRNGEVYHAYPDEKSSALYVGDETAYQRYLSMAQGRKLCDRVNADSSVQFWGCMQEYQEGGRGPRGR